MNSSSPKMATATNTGTDFTTPVEVSGHTFITDEPVEDGGKNLGPSATRLLRAALASCQAITLRSYANRKGLQLKGITVKVDLQSEVSDGKTTYSIFSSIQLEGDLKEEQRQRLREIATRCPVHRILAAGSTITTELV